MKRIVPAILTALGLLLLSLSISAEQHVAWETNVISTAAPASGPLLYDFDRDGYSDIVYSEDAGVRFVWGGPGGSFSLGMLLPLDGDYYGQFITDYIDTDTFPDILFSFDYGLTSGYLHNNGGRSFTLTNYCCLGYASPGYFNDDPFLDIRKTNSSFVSGTSSGALVYPAAESEQPESEAPGSTFSGNGTIEVGDLNGDGFDDFIKFFVGGTGVHLGDGMGGTSHKTIQLSDHVQHTFAKASPLSLIDLNSDNDLDIICEDDGEVYHLINDGSANFTTIFADSVQSTFGNLGDMDGDGDLDIVGKSQVNDSGPCAAFQVSLRSGPLVSDVITVAPSGFCGVLPTNTFVADADHDGDLDIFVGFFGVLFASTNGGVIELKNPSANAPLLSHPMITSVRSSGASYANVAAGLENKITVSTANASNWREPVLLRVVNPNDRDISRYRQTVIGSNYERLHLDAEYDLVLDVRTVDYTVLPGWYKIVLKPNPAANPFAFLTVSVGHGGMPGEDRLLSYNYNGLFNNPSNPQDSAILYQLEEETSTLIPANGARVHETEHDFDWSQRVGVPPPGTTWEMQISHYHDFRDTVEHITSLTQPSHTLSMGLPTNLCYFWRYKSSTDTVWSYAQSFVVYGGCCFGQRGDLSGDGTIDLSDLQILIEFLFFGGPIPGCWEEGDTDGSLGIDVGDLQAIVDHMFFGANSIHYCPF